MNRHNPNSARHQRWLAIYRMVCDDPGINKHKLARLAGMPPRAIDGILCGMDHAGMLLAEDDSGGLYKFTWEDE